EEINGGVELELLERTSDEGVVRQRDFRVEADRQQALDLAGIDLPEQFIGVDARTRQILFVDVPDRRDVPTMVGIADVAPAWQLIAFLSVLASALAVGLAGD